MTMSKIFETLQAALGADVVIDAARAAERASSYWDPSPMRAAALVRPRTTADLSAALKICDGAKQKIVTQGSRTGRGQGDRKRGVGGKRGSGRVDLGGGGI